MAGSEGCCKSAHQPITMAALLGRALNKAPVDLPPSYSPDIDFVRHIDEGAGAPCAWGSQFGAPSAVLLPLPARLACAISPSSDFSHDDHDAPNTEDQRQRIPEQVSATGAEGTPESGAGEEGGEGGRGGQGGSGSAVQDSVAGSNSIECLCVHCLHFITPGKGEGRGVCRHHSGVFDKELTARPRTIVPLAPHKIALLVNFQRVTITFHAPVPVGESGCTNPHLFAIEGRTSAACGFAAISHYELVVDGGLGGRINLPGAQVEATSQLDITGVFPRSDNALEDQGAFLQQRAMDQQDVRPALVASGEPAKRVFEGGGVAAVWHSIRIISRTRQDSARPFDGWRGDESEEIFFTMPEISRPVIAVEHVGDGKQVRITWTLPAAVGGAKVLDFVRLRWRRIAGGRPADLDTPQDGMPSHFIQGTFDPLSRWGLKGASARDVPAPRPQSPTSNGAGNREGARDTAGEKDGNNGQEGAVTDCGALCSLSHDSGSVSLQNSSHDGEWGWMEQTVPLKSLFFIISHLTEGAMYQVEVEVSAKYVGPVLAAAPHPTATIDAGAFADDMHSLTTGTSGTYDDGGITRRTLDTGALASEHASEALSLMGLFGEERGAEKRRGAPSSDASTEQWERNIDEFSRLALLEQHLDTQACPYDEDAISSRLTQRAHSIAAACPSSSTPGTAVRGRFPLSRSASAASPRTLSRMQASETQGPGKTQALTSGSRAHTSRSRGSVGPPRLMLPQERSRSPRRQAGSGSKARVMENLTARSLTQSDLDEAQHAPASELPPVWTEKGWTGAHVQKSLDRYSSVLRDRRKSHVIDIVLPKYSGDREVSKQLQFTALRRPRPVGRPSVFFACSCQVDLPVDLEDAVLQPVNGKTRYCSNSLTLWWFRPEEFEPVMISGYKIYDDLDRSFWVSRYQSELLAGILARQGRLPQNPDSTLGEEFVACAFILPVEARSWISVCVQVAHELKPCTRTLEHVLHVCARMRKSARISSHPPSLLLLPSFYAPDGLTRMKMLDAYADRCHHRPPHLTRWCRSENPHSPSTGTVPGLLHRKFE